MRETRSDDAFDDAITNKNWSLAARLAQERVDERQARHGDAHPELADALADLSYAQRGSGELVAAAEAALAALAIEERVYGPAHARVGEALHRLAQLQLEAHNLSDALVLFERALSVLEAAAGDADPRLAIVCSGLSAVHTEQGELNAATRAIEKALQCLSLAHGPENIDMLAPLDALVQLQEAQGLHEEALHSCERALKIATRKKKDAAPRALLRLIRQALNAGRVDRAQSGAKELLRIEQAHSPMRAEAHALLGECEERMRDFLRAREHYRAALETYRVALPERHPQVAVALMNVATLEVALGEAERAEPLAQEALAIFLDVFGLVHPHTQQMRQGLRAAFLDSGFAAAAERIAGHGLPQ